MSVTLTHEQLQNLLTNAIRAAQQPVNQVVRVPPPAPAPEHPPVDLRRTLNNLMSFKFTRLCKHKFIWLVLQRFWAANPDGFRVIGGIHTTPDGSRSYFSVKGSHEGINFVLHIYGSLRGMFKVKSVDCLFLDEQYPDCWVAHSDSPAGSAASVASDEF